MKHPNRRPTVESVTAIALLLLVAACGGKQTVAVKSAEAFRDAQRKGAPAGGDSHGGHSAGGAAGTTTDSVGDQATMKGMDHSTMAGNSQGGMTGMDHSKMLQGQPMAGMDHSKMRQGQQPMAGMDHSKMQQGQQPMAGMDHSKMQQGQQPMAGMDHSKMQQGQQPMAGMDHGNMPGMQLGAGAAGSVVVSVPTTSDEMQRMRPAATLHPDDFDAPVATSVSEAMKATQGSGGEGQDQENSPAPGPTMDHSQHGQPVPSAKPATQPRTQSRAMTAPKTTPVAATVYACPMHPEVTSDKPGSCPKCGMALVKKK